MKNVWINIAGIAIVIIAVIYIQHKFFPSVIIDTKIEVKKDTLWIHDTTIIKSKPLPPIVINIPDTLVYDSTKCDSLYRDVYSKYNSTLQYSDVIYSDSVVTVELKEKITRNIIFDRETKVTKNIPFVTNTITITNTVYKNSFYIGGIFGKNEITPTLMYSSRNYTILAGYNLSAKTPVVGAGINLNKLFKW